MLIDRLIRLAIDSFIRLLLFTSELKAYLSINTTGDLGLSIVK